MSSPFESVANAKLTFTISGSGLEEDKWGNLTPTKETITLIALLQVGKKSGTTLPDRYLKQGLDVNTQLLEGYLVDPLELPLSIRPPCIGTAEIQFATNRVEKGKIEIIPTPQNPFLISAGVTEVTKFIAIFTQEDVNAV